MVAIYGKLYWAGEIYLQRKQAAVPTQLLMSRKTKTQLPTPDALLKHLMKINVKEMLTMKCQRSQKYYDKTAHGLPDLTESDVLRVKRNPGDKTSKWDSGQIISKLVNACIS